MHHFLLMKMTSIALLVLIPLFVIMVGPMLGQPHAEVVAYFGKPFPALVVVLTMIITFKHFSEGVQVLLEDYVHGTARKVSILMTTCLSYAAMFVGIYAIAKIVL